MKQNKKGDSEKKNEEQEDTDCQNKILRLFSNDASSAIIRLDDR